MWKRWYAVLYLCVVYTDILQSVSGILPDIATLCPYNDFCHSKATKVRKPDELNLIPCCQICSCESDCQLFGNCCPDKELTADVEVIYPCIDIATYFNDPRGILVKKNINVHYRVIDKCPSAILDLVYPRCSYITELEDFIFVSDPSTERVYKNKHCALCNGITRYTEWRLLTDCPSSTVGRNIEEWHSYIKENCSIIPVPPNPLNGDLVRCHQRTDVGEFFRCNDTGVWKTYDKDIDMACNTENPYTNNVFTHEFIDRWVNKKSRYFENVYCKFCNKRHDEIWPDLCERNLPVFVEKGFRLALSVFINFQTQSAEDSSIAQRCYRSQMWNPFNESCMNVICPSSTFLNEGTCENMYKRMTGDTYALMFRIISNTIPYTVDLLRSLDQLLTVSIGNTECEICGIAIKVDYKSNYHLEYLVTTRDGCSEDFLLSKVENFTQYPLLSLYLGNASRITMVYSLDAYITENMAFALPPLDHHFCAQFNYVTWEMVDKCPRIPISYLDSLDSIYQIKTERNGTLCVNEYFKIMESVHNSQMTTHAHVHVFFSMIVILVCIFAAYNTL